MNKRLGTFLRVESVAISLLISLFSFAASAQSLCSQALMSPLSEVQIQSTVDGLARLKFALDLAQVNNPGALTIRAMSHEYVTKITELKVRLEGQKSHEEIRDLIKERISLLQQINGESKKVEKQNRKKEKIVVPGRANWLPQDFAALFSSGNPRIEYLEKSQSFFYIFQTSLKSYSTASKETSFIANDWPINFALSPDAKQIHYVTKGNRLKTFDLQTNTIVSDKKLRIDLDLMTNRENTNLAVSPDGKTIILTDRHQNSFYSTKSGRYLERPNLGPNIRNLRFTSNSTLLFSSGKDVISYNLKDQTRQKVAELKYDYLQWEVSSDNSTIIVLEGLFISSTPLDANNQQAKTVPNEYWGPGVKLIQLPSSQGNQFLISTPRVSTAIFDAANLKSPRFTFMDKYGRDDLNESVEQAQLTHDGKSVLLLIKDSDTFEIRSEIWALAE